MFSGLSSTALKDILSSVEPVELKGVALLRQYTPTSSLIPTAATSDELVEATIEIIDYTRACEASLRRLTGLRPIPVTGTSIEEYSL
ncbi:MAG: hypothetical protein JXJ17_12030 [Anaerolineae bacterium]|nr:hypothetical protein [Anaerolineae bacterium]